ncbi:MAG: HAD-IIIA family hydrolase, partial [Chitinophagaceae bacterium]|nr:HAD-IIIA family hydrolase [Chitinophagaceae bacterium]
PYTLHKDQFKFYEGTTEALKIFNNIFQYILVVTNQRGVAKKLMTEDDLLNIHDFMLSEVKSTGGRIDRIYYCTAINDDHPNRKPNPGMALEAMQHHPLISKEHSIMVGNNISDMQFGRNAGMHTVLLTTTNVRVELPHPLVDRQYDSLIEFARDLSSSTESVGY